MDEEHKIRVVQFIARLYFYACVSLLVGFFPPFFFEPLKVLGSSILRAVMPQLSPVLGTFAYGFVVATLSLFTWNFLAGAGPQVCSVQKLLRKS